MINFLKLNRIMKYFRSFKKELLILIPLTNLFPKRSKEKITKKVEQFRGNALLLLIGFYFAEQKKLKMTC